MDGITIQNGYWSVNGREDAENVGENGDDAGGNPQDIDGVGHNHGGAIYIYAGASPVIKNCVIKDSHYSSLMSITRINSSNVVVPCKTREIPCFFRVFIPCVTASDFIWSSEALSTTIFLMVRLTSNIS